MLYRRYNAVYFEILHLIKRKKKSNKCKLKNQHTEKEKTYKGSNGVKIAHMEIKILIIANLVTECFTSR